MAIRGRELILAVVAALAMSAAPAQAATHTVWSCRDQADRAAPASDTSGGWKASGLGLGRDASDLCESSAPRLTASIGGQWSFPIGTAVTWQFTAPPSTYLAGVEVVYSGYARPSNGQNDGLVELWAANSGRLALHQGVGNFGATVLSRTGLREPWTAVRIYCDGHSGNPDCPAGQTHATDSIWRSTMTITDEVPPAPAPPPAATSPPPPGKAPQVFAFPATDDGGGVYQAILSVDGVQLLARTVNDWGGRCVDTTAGSRVFRYPRPCLTSVDALVPVDASQLPAGDP
jgi:opacity protein-like surface antigen